ncbi:MAG: peptide ABC transporter substrate-binding protein, partial [Oscillospiraceae bacterium]|nr:peptide ABC transporter substrate-binding protein [Oscillospiraceae bacterium]
MILNLTACGKGDGKDRVLKYDISDNPATLDPQQANEPNSDIIIENVYMGLMAINADGSVRAAAATDFVVSDDGLKYEFKLRNDIYWVNSEGFQQQCTAKDFVYGFTRLFLPETSAPRAC